MSLRNEDFRKLLATPRPGAQPNLDAQAGEKKQRKPRPPRPPRAKANGDDDEEEGEEGQQYRDRASERRKGLGGELEGVLVAEGGVLGSVQGADLSHLTYDESKFLGGDVEHTHLVKGLDYALLNKIKSQQPGGGKGGAQPGADEGPAAGSGGGPSAAPDAGAPRAVTFSSSTGRAVHDFLFGSQRRAARTSVAEQFLPRRTAFLYELEDVLAPDAPTTLRRSKDDCPVPREKLSGGLDAAVLERMAKIMAYMTVAGGGRKKLKKKERQRLLQEHGLDGEGAAQAAQPSEAAVAVPPAAPAVEGPQPAAAPEDDDEDIFGDAGTDYVVERKQPEAPVLPAAPGPRPRYFEGAALEEGQGAAVGPALPGPHAAAAYPEADAYGAYPDTDAAYPDTDAAFAAAEAAAEAREEEAKQREERRRRMLAEAHDDGYAECYPEYHDMAGTMYDSEDDDGRGAPPAEPEEAEPSKGGEKKAARREAFKARLKESNKTAAALTKIKQIFSDKGYEHDKAFQEGEAPKPGRKADESIPVLPAKKRRI